jgi:hypothetical protein
MDSRTTSQLALHTRPLSGLDETFGDFLPLLFWSTRINSSGTRQHALHITVIIQPHHHRIGAVRRDVYDLQASNFDTYASSATLGISNCLYSFNLKCSGSNV